MKTEVIRQDDLKLMLRFINRVSDADDTFDGQAAIKIMNRIRKRFWFMNDFANYRKYKKLNNGNNKG